MRGRTGRIWRAWRGWRVCRSALLNRVDGRFIHRQQCLHAQLLRLFREALDGIGVQAVVLHTSLHEGRLLPRQVVRGGGGMVVQVVAKIEGFFIKTFGWHKGLGVEANAAFGVQVHHTQTQPFVQHHTGANVAVHTRHQAFKRLRATFAGVTRQRQRLAVFVQVGRLPLPLRHQLRPQRHHGRHVFALGGRGMAQAENVFAVHAGEQGDTAVGGLFGGQLKVFHRHFHHERLEQL